MLPRCYVLHVLLRNAHEVIAWYKSQDETAWRKQLAERLERVRAEAYERAQLDAGQVQALETREDFLRLGVAEAVYADRLSSQVLSAPSVTAEPRLSFGIGIACGSEAEVLPTATDARLFAERALPGEIVVSEDVYAKLPPSVWDRYGAWEIIKDRKIRRGFAEALRRCFVISPFGRPNTEERKRSDYVFETFIKRACAAEHFRPIRSDKELSSAIFGDMTAALATDPMVIAYVAQPPWNPNVMIEIGYRLATRNPIVFLCDALEGWDPPFDLKDHQFIELPPEDRGDESIINNAISRLSRALGNPPQGSEWGSEHPFAEIDIDTVRQEQVILRATTEAERMFGKPDGLTNVPVGEVIGWIRRFMPEGQYEAFSEEQCDLIGRLVAAGVSRGQGVSDVTASVPMFFEEHPVEDFRERAFLPVIVRHRHNSGVLTLDVVYLDVTSATRVDPDGRFITRLSEARGAVLIWDLYATSYDRILPELSFYREVRDRHVKAMSREDVQDVLELGAGTGNVTIPLLERGRRVIAVDTSRAMLDLMRAKVQDRDHRDDRILILEQTAEYLPALRSGRYDGVSSMLALFAMEKPMNALSEAIRLLRPGGHIVITEPKESFQMEPLLEHAREELEASGQLEALEADWNRVMHVNRHINPERATQFRAERICSILETRGFRDVRMTDSYLGHCATIEATKQG